MLPVYLALALVAMSIIVLEVALTRVFAIMMWHHLSYMVVSIAMLGLGAAGSFLTFRGESGSDGSERSVQQVAKPLSALCLAYGASTIAALVAVTRLEVDTVSTIERGENLLTLGAVYAIATIPFIFGGLVVGLTITRLSPFIARLYFFDLSGSAVGAAASVLLLAELGAGATAVAAGCMGLLAGGIYALATRNRALTAALPGFGMALVLGYGLMVGLPGLGDGPWRPTIPIAPGKELAGVANERLTRIYSATAEVQVSDSVRLPPIAGGEFGRVDRSWIQGRFVAQDGTAPTALYKDGADLDRYPFLDDSQTAAPYVAIRARGEAPSEVLAIGVGGGIDVMIALAHGADRVVAVELNEAMIEMVTDRFGDYIGGLFEPGAHPLAENVELVHAEGRAFARRSDARFDVIQLAGVDSFTALSTGAYTLAESYLYTTEAVRDLYDRLRDGGILCFSRFIMRPPQKPRETMRLAFMAATALKEGGVDEPERYITVFQGLEWAATLVKRGAFTAEEVAALQEFARSEGFAGLLYDPTGSGASPLEQSAGDQVAPDPATVELLETLLRGTEDERERLLAEYEYDLTPATDDSPFFFNYYRYRALARRLISGERGSSHRYSGDFPTGHMVLLASLGQVALIAALLILAPIRRLGRGSATVALPVFGYFSALGMGFMLIEIALMQKMVLFLGHPTYAVALVLGSLLAFAGLGSLVSGRLDSLRPRTYVVVGACVVVLIALSVVMVDQLLPSILSLPFAGRAVVGAATIAPLALALGIPFPLGMNALRQRRPLLMPWAWSINAFFSVISSVVCILAAMAFGFTVVFGLAASIYVAGFVAIGRWLAREEVRGA